MTHVVVTIHGKQYRMACEDGQEDHLMRLARDLDSRVEQLKTFEGAAAAPGRALSRRR